jgi:hypothetical protein
VFDSPLIFPPSDAGFLSLRKRQSVLRFFFPHFRQGSLSRTIPLTPFIILIPYPSEALGRSFSNVTRGTVAAAVDPKSDTAVTPESDTGGKMRTGNVPSSTELPKQ